MWQAVSRIRALGNHYPAVPTRVYQTDPPSRMSLASFEGQAQKTMKPPFGGGFIENQTKDERIVVAIDSSF